MRLTKKRAIEIAIELWTWLTETGERKGDWPEWDKYEYMISDCPLCTYSNRKSPKAEDYCLCCPYYMVFGRCTAEDTPYDRWDIAETKRTRKKYASLFLGQLRQL